jgi:hypothetical protein
MRRENPRKKIVGKSEGKRQTTQDLNVNEGNMLKGV